MTPIAVDEDVPELASFPRQNPSSREELVLVGKGSLDLHQISSHEVLPRDLLDSRKMVNFLIWLHLGKEIWRNSNVVPSDIPVFREFLSSLAILDASIPVLLSFFEYVIMVDLGNFPNDVVLSAKHIHDGPPPFLPVGVELPLHHEHLVLQRLGRLGLLLLLLGLGLLVLLFFLAALGDADLVSEAVLHLVLAVLVLRLVLHTL